MTPSLTTLHCKEQLWNGATALENRLAVLQLVKLWASSSTLSCVSKRGKTHTFSRNCTWKLTATFTPNNQKTGKPQVPINRWMGKRNVFSHDGILSHYCRSRAAEPWKHGEVGFHSYGTPRIGQATETENKLRAMAHACNPSYWEAAVRRFVLQSPLRPKLSKRLHLNQ
jgi:hypothetical protein